MNVRLSDTLDGFFRLTLSPTGPMPNQREKTKKLPKCPECGHRLKRLKPKRKDRPVEKVVICRNPRCRADKVSSDGKKILSDKTPKL